MVSNSKIYRTAYHNRRLMIIYYIFLIYIYICIALMVISFTPLTQECQFFASLASLLRTLELGSVIINGSIGRVVNRERMVTRNELYTFNITEDTPLWTTTGNHHRKHVFPKIAHLKVLEIIYFLIKKNLLEYRKVV